MASIIDWHAHWIPPQLADALRARSHPPRIVSENDADTLVREEGSPGQPLVPTFVSLSSRLKALDEAGVERQVISLPGLFGNAALPLKERLELTRAFNEGLSELTTAHPDRFSGLAILPVADPGVAAEELERAIRDLGLLGALLPVDAFLTLESARELRPILEVAERFQAHLFIHPGPWRDSRRDEGKDLDTAHYRTGVLDLQGRISSAFVTLAYTDLLEQAPHVTVQLANLGGALPFYADRLVNTANKRGLTDPIAPLKRFYVDTGSLSTNSIELTARVLGADRILFGTDDPVFSLPANVKGVQATRLTAEERQGILSENGRPLLKKSRKPAS